MRSIVALLPALLLSLTPAPADGELESQGGGLQTASFDTISGTVTVNLPEDVAAGDTLSGTVVAEPEGDDEKKKEKNRGALAGYLFELADHPRGRVGDGRLSLDIPEDARAATLILREVDKKGRPGREIGRVEIPVRESVPSVTDFRLPSLSQHGQPLRVAGPFDGDLSSTALRFAGRDAQPLAESPRGAIFRAPTDATGVTEVSVHEQGHAVAEGQIRNIATSLAAPKLNLTAGETTTLSTRVTGLEELDEEVPLTLRLWPRSVIDVEGGYLHERTIRPEDVGPGGVYAFDLRVTGRTTGSWTAQVRVVPPEPEEPSRVARWILVLEGSPVGEIEPLEPLAGDRTPTFAAGLGLEQPFYEWIDSNMAAGPQRRDGRIEGVDDRGRSLESHVFQRALVQSVAFPALDTGDDSPAAMTVTLSAESVREARGSGETFVAGNASANWRCSNFRFEIGDLPLERVNKIDRVTWEQKVAETEISISSADLSTWERWHRGFYIVDRTRPAAADGRLVFLGPDRERELGAIAFHGTTVSTIEVRPSDGESDATHTVSIDLRGTRLSLDR